MATRKCYEGSLKSRRRCMHVEREGILKGEKVDPRVDFERECPQPAEEIRIIKIGEGKSLKISSKIKVEEEERLAKCLRENLGAFAWSVGDMSGIDLGFMCHHLAVDPKAKPMVQHRRKLGEEKRMIVD